jgi:hypothetical protein
MPILTHTQWIYVQIVSQLRQWLVEGRYELVQAHLKRYRKLGWNIQI